MEATRQIDWLVSEVVAPFMKKAGFKRRRLAFSRPFQHGYDVLVLQKSSWNSTADARFTFNLGIYWSKAEEINGSQVAGVPFSDGQCTVWDRIGFLMQPPGDKWWIINSQRNVLELPDEILRVIGTYAFPWFEEGHNVDRAIQFALKHHHIAKIRALELTKHE